MNRTRSRSLPRWVLLGLVLGGLLLMHGLSVHGAHNAMPGPETETMHAVASLDEVVAMPGHDHVSVEVLCLAVLPVGLLLLRRAARHLVRRAAASAVRAHLPVPRSRSPDPPTPALLSICRC